MDNEFRSDKFLLVVGGRVVLPQLMSKKSLTKLNDHTFRLITTTVDSHGDRYIFN